MLPIIRRSRKRTPFRLPHWLGLSCFHYVGRDPARSCSNLEARFARGIAWKGHPR
jgi:hypothetical protein